MSRTGCLHARFVPTSMSKLNCQFPLLNRAASNATDAWEHPRHRWYEVKEAFSPRMVAEAGRMEGVERGDRLFDPFCGSGTVAVSGALSALNVSAIEVNPFLHFVAKTKLCQANSKEVSLAAKDVLAATRRQSRSPLEGYSTFSEGNRWGRWLFPTPVLRSFESARQATKSLSDPIRDLHLLALIGAAMDCCNAFRDGKCLRYGTDWPNHQSSSEDFTRRFTERIDRIAEDLDAAPILGETPRIEMGDARKVLEKPEIEPFRLCVTSPPYLNSFDYSDVYRPEMFLGGFVQTTAELRAIRLKTIRSHVQASWALPTRNDFGPLYQKSIEQLKATGRLWDRRIPVMIQAYFEDMSDILRKLKDKARDKASLWVVVSTSAYNGVEIPVDLVLADIGQRLGWFLREVGVLRYLRSSSQHVKYVDEDERKSVPLRESVVIFDAKRPTRKRLLPAHSVQRGSAI